MGSSIGCTYEPLFGVLMMFTTLTKVARSIFLLCRLDWYWSSVGPPDMKLMVGRGSDGCSAPIIALSATRVVSVQWVDSRMYLLRCPARINFCTRNFKLWQRLVLWPWSLW